MRFALILMMVLLIPLPALAEEESFDIESVGGLYIESAQSEPIPEPITNTPLPTSDSLNLPDKPTAIAIIILLAISAVSMFLALFLNKREPSNPF